MFKPISNVKFGKCKNCGETIVLYYSAFSEGGGNTDVFCSLPDMRISCGNGRHEPMTEDGVVDSILKKYNA